LLAKKMLNHLTPRWFSRSGWLVLSGLLTNLLGIQPAPATEFWFAPSWWMVDQAQLFSRAFDWQSLQQEGVSTYKIWLPHLYIGKDDAYLKGSFGFGCSPQTLTAETCPAYFQALRALQSSGLQLSVEVALDHPRWHPAWFGQTEVCQVSSLTGAATFGRRLAQLHDERYFQPWISRGGPLHSIALDGPFNKILRGGLDADCGFTDASVARQAIISYLLELRQRLGPQVDFIYLENLPLWQYQGLPGDGPIAARLPDLHPLLTDLLRTSRRWGVGFSALQVDAPYGFLVRETPQATGRALERLRRLAEWSQANQLAFQIVVNSAVPVVEPNALPLRYQPQLSQRFFSETLKMTELLRQQYRSQLQAIVLQSWMIAPYSVFPAFPADPYSLRALMSAVSACFQQGRCTAPPPGLPPG
jgi:hypothetical protein